jgi:hypothetical protein
MGNRDGNDAVVGVERSGMTLNNISVAARRLATLICCIERLVVLSEY